MPLTAFTISYLCKWKGWLKKEIDLKREKNFWGPIRIWRFSFLQKQFSFTLFFSKLKYDKLVGIPYLGIRLPQIYFKVIVTLVADEDYFNYFRH